MTSRSRRWLPWIAGFLPLAVLILVAILFYSAWARAGRVVESQRRWVAERLSALRAVKVERPMQFEPAEAGNSWEPMSAALKGVSEIPDEALLCLPDREAFRPEDSPDPSPEDSARLKAMVTPHLEALRGALRRSKVEPGFDFDYGADPDISVGSGAILLSQILEHLAGVALEQGRPDEVVDYVLIGLGVADRLTVKSYLIRDLMAQVVQGNVLDTLKKALEQHSFSAAQLRRLLKALEAIDSDRTDWIEKENLYFRSILLNAFDKDLGELGAAGAFVPSARHYFSSRIMLAEWFEWHERYYREVEAVTRLPIWERPAAAAEISRRHGSSGSFLQAMTQPQVASTLAKFARAAMNLRLAKVAVALAIHAAEQRRFPDQLSGLVPDFLRELPVDTFGGLAFTYSLSEAGAFLASQSRDPLQKGKALGESASELDWGFPSWRIRRP